MEATENNEEKEPVNTNQKDNADRNDPIGPDDDTIGENTEITPVAAAILKDRDARVLAKENQENKDFSEKNG